MSDKPIFSESVIKAAEELTTRFPFKPFYDEQVFDTAQVIQEVVDAACEELRNEVAYLNDRVSETEQQASRAIEDAKHDAMAEAEREMRSEFRQRGWTRDE